MFLINQQLLSTTQNITFNLKNKNEGNLNTVYDLLLTLSNYNNINASNMFVYSNNLLLNNQSINNYNYDAEFTYNTNDVEVLLNNNLNIYMSVVNSLTSHNKNVKYNSFVVNTI
jgi:hypothetical protein